MPLYEYECDACGHRFEVIQKFSDSPIEQCPKCGSSVHKLMSSPAFQFKGSGWYVTDYARKDKETSDTKETKDTKDTKETKEGKDAKESKETKESKTEKSSSDSSSAATSAPAPPSKDSPKDT